MKRIAVALLLLVGPMIVHAAWPTYQGNADHTGFVREHTKFSTTPLWEVDVPAPASGLAIGHGMVYVSPTVYFSEAPFLALDLKTGEEVWRIDFSGLFSVNPPALDGEGSVYFVTGNHETDTYMRAYDALTGSFHWRTNQPAQWERYLAPTIVDGMVATNGGSYGGLYVFDPVFGDKLYSADLPQYDGWTPVPWGAHSWVVFTEQIDVIDRATGAITATIPVPDYGWRGWTTAQTPVVVNDVAYLTNDGRLLGFDLVAETLVVNRAINADGQISTDGERLYLVANGVLSVRDLAGNALHAMEVPSESLQAPIILTKSHAVVGTGGAFSGGATAIFDLRARRHVATLPFFGQMGLAEDTLVIAGEGSVKAYAMPMRMFIGAFED